MVIRFVLIFFLLASGCVQASSISFRISLTGMNVTLEEHGDGTAFFPSVLMLRPDGKWQVLPAAGVPKHELNPGEREEFSWHAVPFGKVQPIMVRFFDAAGVDFGQVSFFNQPPPSLGERLNVVYTPGKLRIYPPGQGSSIRSTWVFWPKEEGTAAITGRPIFSVVQPDALHVAWGKEKDVDTGPVSPPVYLLHETTTGYYLQVVAGLPMDNRAWWLNRHSWFFLAAAVLACAALLVRRRA